MQYIRIYNKERGAYYISAVYGRCDVFGYPARLILFDPFVQTFILLPEAEKHAEGYLNLIYDQVLFSQEDFVHIKGAQLLAFKRYAREQGFDADGMSFFQGSPEVLRHKDFLLRVLRDGRVPLGEADIPVQPLTGTDGWTYLHTPEDAAAFMRRVYGFHDCTLEEMRYDGASLSLTIDAREWADMWVELCFEGNVDMNLRHSYAPNTSLWGISAMDIGNCHVFFSLDSEITEKEAAEPDSGVTWVTSIAVKWRKIEPPDRENE